MKYLTSILPVSVLAAGLAAVTFSPAQAEYPEHDIQMYVNGGAGGSTDTGARILAHAMEKTLGQPVIVINKPGGGGTKGVVLLSKEKPDGYTIGFSYSHNLTFAPQYKRPKPLYTLDQFDFIGSITSPKNSIVSLAHRGWSNLKEMVAKLKSEGKPLTMVYSGGAARLIGHAVAKDFGIEVKIIRVRGGGKSMQRVLGGHVDVVYTGGAHVPYTEAGKTIVLATVDEERNPAYPKVLTYKEQGGHASATTLQIVFAPKGLPAAVKAKLAAAVTAASTDPDVVKLFKNNLKMPIRNLKGAALDSYLRAEYARYTDLIKKYDE